ncbi:MAG: DUF2520 domain-containing protein [Clostridium sp.]|nr:DUF2520 domain-containing protein [Clostridium sp.]
MDIGIIGAGRVGCAFGIGLKNSNFSVSGVYSKSDKSQIYLNKKLKGRYANDLKDTIENSKIILMTVPDDSIGAVAKRIVTNIPQKFLHSKIFIHLSGAMSSEVLEPLRGMGGHIASLHPAQTFADKENGWKGLYDIYYGFEGCKEAEDNILKIVKAFRGKIVHVDRGDKPLYHMAACIISNYTVTLSHIAQEILKSIGIEQSSAREIFVPLIMNTVYNIQKYGSVDALTGPIARGDCSVVKEHLRALGSLKPKMGNIYKVLGNATVDLALEKESISDEEAKKIKNLFLS